MNNLLKSAARRHAIANGIRTASWSDEDIAGYARKHGITERDNLLSDDQLAQKEAPVEAPASVDAAVRALIDAAAPKLDEDRVVELIKTHGTMIHKHVVEVHSDDSEPVVIEGQHKDFPTVMSMIAAGVNVCAVGPAGSGKSTIFENAAKALGLDYYFQGAVQQEHKVLGYMDGNGQYHRTQFRDAYEHGGLFVFEEYDGSGPRALLAINNAVAGNWADFPDGKIAKHENFVCVMAGNTFGTGSSRQYVGRAQIDAATLDRFAFIEIGYDEDLEREIALAEWDQADGWVSLVQEFRAQVSKAGLRHVVSPRATIMGAKMRKRGVPTSVCVKALLHKGLPEDQLAQLA